MNKTTPLAYIELSRVNLIHNIKSLKSLAKKGTKFSVALKGNAYGHGQNEIARILEPYVDYFQVDGIEELELLRKVTKKETLVLGYVSESGLSRAIKLGCILAVFSFEQLRSINKVALRFKKKQEIHISVDAHLGREGFLLEDLPKLFQEIKKLKNIKLSGMYSHFANIEDTTDFSHAQKQIDEYGRALDMAREFGFKNIDTHISATSGLFAYEKNKGVNSLVRLGIGVYGLWPSEDLKKQYENKLILKPVLSWKTKVAQVKTLKKGETVGYGLTYVTKKETKIALIPQGYADGLERRFSNNGSVLIRGRECPILGRVSMNMFVVDVSELEIVNLEDEVVILGLQNKAKITAETMASRIGTINYEITTKISSLLPRVIIG